MNSRLIIRLVIIGFALALVLEAIKHPFINDVTTTPNDPPIFMVLPQITQRSYSYPKENAQIQIKAYPGLSPLKLKLSPDLAFQKILELIAETPKWVVVSSDPINHHIELVARTPLHINHDVVIEIRTSDGQTALHMRSKTRFGQADFGSNARFILDFIHRAEPLGSPVAL